MYYNYKHNLCIQIYIQNKWSIQYNNNRELLTTQPNRSHQTNAKRKVMENKKKDGGD